MAKKKKGDGGRGTSESQRIARLRFLYTRQVEAANKLLDKFNAIRKAKSSQSTPTAKAKSDVSLTTLAHRQLLMVQKAIATLKKIPADAHKGLPGLPDQAPQVF